LNPAAINGEASNPGRCNRTDEIGVGWGTKGSDHGQSASFAIPALSPT
jgi:hypothetical protein